MNPERHERVKKLFLAACELAETARQAFIEQACGDDAEIRREVESLLRYHRDETVLERSHPPQPAGGKAETLATEPGLEGITPLPLSSGRPPRYVAGTVVAGRFRIVTLLGRGGMGEVYRAEDLHLHRTVALKFLAGSRATDPVWLARFYNEARLSLTVTNPHVCRVYDIGRVDDEAFICMEYVDGEDLASLLKRIGRLTADKVVDIARQLCHGLGAAHAMGVLHRDLKPANIMLDGRGHVRITDFGIAALVTPGNDTPIPAGTPGYMAPELLRGKAATVRSDLYALGLVLYEMLTGRKASPAPGPDGYEQRTAVVPPSHVIEDVDPALERAILRCTAESPEDRPSSVYEVLALLPGGDPLAAALAAGEIPAPELLAAVSAASKPPLIVARICLAVSVAGLALALVLAGRTTLFAQAGLTKPPEVLDEIAREIVASLGGPDHGKVTSGRFFINPRFSHSPGDTPATPGAQSQAGIGGSPMVFYEYPLPGSSSATFFSFRT